MTRSYFLLDTLQPRFREQRIHVEHIAYRNIRHQRVIYERTVVNSIKANHNMIRYCMKRTKTQHIHTTSSSTFAETKPNSSSHLIIVQAVNQGG
jgi:hypothetical protein